MGKLSMLYTLHPKIQLARQLSNPDFMSSIFCWPFGPAINIWLALASNKYLTGPKGQHMILYMQVIICWALWPARYFCWSKGPAKDWRLEIWDSLTGGHCKLDHNMLGSLGMWNPISHALLFIGNNGFFFSY